MFDVSCEEICNSKAFVDIPTAGRNRGLSTIYIKHNLFLQSKPGRDVELQSKHIILLKSPRDVMQVITPGAQMGTPIRACWLVSRHNICSLRLFIDWLVATHRRSITLLYKHRIHSLKILYPGAAEKVESFGRSTHKISLLSQCSNHFPTNAKVFSFSLAQKTLSGFFANAQ